MSWTNPKTWSVGEKVTAALLNAYLRDNQLALAPSGGEWADYTPAFTSLTVGNGTLTGRSVQLGKIVMFTWELVLGSSSSVGTGPTVSLPVTAAIPITDQPIGTCRLADVGTAAYIGVLQLASSTVASIRVANAASTYTVNAGITAAIPHTWTQNDIIQGSGLYEAA